MSQPEGYRDFIEVIECPDEDGIIISAGDYVVRKTLRKWVEEGWNNNPPRILPWPIQKAATQPPINQNPNPTTQKGDK